MASPYAALANGGERFQAFQQFQQNNPDLAGKELKMQFRDEWKSIGGGNNGIPGGIHHNAELQNLIAPTQSGVGAGSDNVANQLSKLEIKAARQALKLGDKGLGNIDNFRTIQDVGSKVVGANNLSIDLGSAVENITLGSNLFRDAGSVTITVGSESKTLSAGSKVTAAEYVAAKQVLIAGGQKVTIDASRTATGGSVDLSALTTGNQSLRIDDLKITEGVTAYGDFGKGGDVRISGDLVNNGGIFAYSSDKNVDVANVRADNIVNSAGASISSGLNAEHGGVVENVSLGLYANDSLANYGNINSAGDLTLSAGANLANTGTVVAQNNVNLQAPDVSNSGTITSIVSNINLDSSIASTLNVNNSGGTLNALDGAINIRAPHFKDALDTSVTGGDLYSKEVNINSGKGLTTVDVNDLTGIVSSTGTAAHVWAKTDTLRLGTQCLTGDPTYYNASGNIDINGDMTVNDNLAIIASGDITGAGARSISSQGFNVIMVAGATVTGGGPQFPLNATSDVTVNPSSATGGNIDFSFSSELNLDTDGGHVTLIAFADTNAGTNKGNILLNSGSIIDTGRPGGTAGNLTVIAGGASGDAIVLGNLRSDGVVKGSISIINAQPISSDGAPITFSPTGIISSGNTFVPDLQHIGTATIKVQSFDVKSDVEIRGGTLILNNLHTHGGDFNVNVSGNLTFASDFVHTEDSSNNNGSLNIDAASIYVSNGLRIFTGDINDGSGAVVVRTRVGGISGGAGNIFIDAGTSIELNLNDVVNLQNVGSISLIATDLINVNKTINTSSTTSANSGSIYVNATGIIVADLITDNTAGGSAGTVQLIATKNGSSVGFMDLRNISARATSITGGNGAEVSIRNSTGGQIIFRDNSSIRTNGTRGNSGAVYITTESGAVDGILQGPSLIDTSVSSSSFSSGLISLTASSMRFINSDVSFLAKNGSSGSNGVILTTTKEGITTNGYNFSIESFENVVIDIADYSLQTSQNNTRAGDIKILTEGQLLAAGEKLSASNSLANSRVGNIIINASGITVGELEASSYGASMPGTPAGAVSVEYGIGGASIGTIDTSVGSGYGSGGPVIINSNGANPGELRVDSINTEGHGSGVGGFVGILTSSNKVLIGVINTQGFVDGGNVDIQQNSVDGELTVNNVSSRGSYGRGGHLLLDSQNGEISFSGFQTGGNTANGYIEINARSLVTERLIIDTTGSAGSAAGDVTFNITESGFGNAERSTTIDSSGNIELNLGGSRQLIGNFIELHAVGDILAPLVEINTSSLTTKGGNVEAIAGEGRLLSLGGIKANSDTGKGGDISLRAGSSVYGTIAIQYLESNGSGSGGEINFRSRGQNGTLLLPTISATGGLYSDSTINVYSENGDDLVLQSINGSAIRIVSSGSIRTNADISATANILLRTNHLVNSHTIDSTNGDIAIISQTTGGILFDGGTGGTLRATNGDITVRADAGNLTLAGKTTYASAASLVAEGPGQQIIGQAGSMSIALANSLLSTSSLSGDSTFITIGETWTISNTQAGILLNNPGDVVISGDLTFSGGDLAILSRGNIIFDNANVNLSGAKGGSLTMLAGYNFSATTNSQQYDNFSVINSFAPTGAGSISGNADINLSSTSGAAGNLVAFANGGNIALGDINISTVNGLTGNVSVAATGNVAVGNIVADGAGISSISSISLASAIPILSNNFSIYKGSIYNGSYSLGAVSTGTVTVGNINSGARGSVNVQTGSSGSAAFNGEIIANKITVSAGVINFGLNDDVSVHNAVNGSERGIIRLTANSISNTSGHLQLNANASNGEVAGLIEVNYLGNSLTLGSSGKISASASGVGEGNGGNIQIVSNGDLIVGADGLSANGSGVGGNGGSLAVSAGKNVTINAGAINVNSAGTGNGGAVEVDSVGDVSLFSNSVSAIGGGDAGSIRVDAAGNVTVASNGVNLRGLNGVGATIILRAGTDGNGALNLQDTNFLSQANASGANSDGGEIGLSAEIVNYLSSANAPLVLSANGLGNGDAGFISYSDRSSKATLIGPNPVQKNGGSNYLEVSALSGASGNGGGTIDISVGGNLVVNTQGLRAGLPSGLSGQLGSNFSLSAGESGKKGGTLVINGDLDARGVTGGSIDLAARSSKIFTLKSATISDNGVNGHLLTSGIGSINIANSLGGILIGASDAITTNVAAITAGGKGPITTAPGAILTASQSLYLTGGSGAIGGKTPLLFSSSAFGATTAGLVSVNNVSANPLLIYAGSFGKSFAIETAGSVNVNSISTSRGAISIISSGNINVAANSKVTANGGALTLQNRNLQLGGIDIGSGATVETQGKGGQTSIIIGGMPQSGTNPYPPGSAPLGITVRNVGRGIVFFGPGGVVSNGNSTVNAINKNVLFNNSSTGGGLISLGNNSTVTADPPSPTPNIGPVNLGEASTISIAINSNDEPSAFELPQLSTLKFGNILTSLLTVNSEIAKGVRSGAIGGASAMVASDEDDSFAVGRNISGVGIDASICSDLGFVHDLNGKGQSLPGVALVSHAQRMVFNNGNVLLAPQVDTVVETQHGNVTVAGKSVVLISATNAGLAVFDFDDQHKGSVSVEANGHHVVLSPGRHVMVTPHHHAEFAQINAVETVAHRNIASTIKGGYRAHVSEFSIPSAMDSVKPLKAMVMSNHPDAKRVAARMLKTTAVVMQLGGGKGEYQHYFKPRMSAMAK